MSTYDFSTLAPGEFEELSRDLLQRHLEVQLQGYTSGPDGGIDLRHCPAVGNDWVVQCKHFPGARFSSLKAHMKKEARKLEKLKPARYVVATSAGLTPKNVDALFEMLSPYCRSKHDILGREDLNAILREHEDIERAHPKLWLTSEAALTRMLQNDVFVQSKMTRESAKRRLSLYVYTPQFDTAREMLAQKRVCIISGTPGVGKTTLAEMLLLEFLEDGWEVITIDQNVTEGLRGLSDDDDRKQVFYYDDFLGQISAGEKLAKNEDRSILGLIDAVTRHKNRRFILTTREYILAQARTQHEKLDRAHLDIYQFVLECTEYNEAAKARILANHLYFSHVPQRHIAALVKGRRYREIIDHPNYNPRVIEGMTSTMETRSCKPSKYPVEFIQRLENPSEIWRHAYDEQLSHASRHLLLALASCGDPISASDINAVFDSLHANRCREFGWERTPRDFHRALNELEGNFIRIWQHKNGRLIEFHNPSVLDFMGEVFKREPGDLASLLETGHYFEQLGRMAWQFNVFSEAKTFPAPSLVASFIRKHIRSRAVKLWSRRGGNTWGATSRSSDPWGRCLTCLSIAGAIGGATQTTVLEQVRGLFNHIETTWNWAGDTTGLLDGLHAQSWVDTQFIRQCEDTFETFLRSTENEYVYDVDDIVTIAEWIDEQDSRFPDRNYNELRESLSAEVTSKVENAVGDDEPGTWSSLRDAVESLEGLLHTSFPSELDIISEEEERTGRYDEVASNESPARRTPDHDSEIDSLFDSLLR